MYQKPRGGYTSLLLTSIWEPLDSYLERTMHEYVQRVVGTECPYCKYVDKEENQVNSRCPKCNGEYTSETRVITETLRRE